MYIWQNYSLKIYFLDLRKKVGGASDLSRGDFAPCPADHLRTTLGRVQNVKNCTNLAKFSLLRTHNCANKQGSQV